ncbi:hypothetical protein PG997_013898 [Apiospora hydei]|uniref:Uncharacterized protein n=1 Tax=Apiospora hydei TaxID=1337664 RepID=A0ABR1V7I3_9PEZI
MLFRKSKAPATAAGAAATHDENSKISAVDGGSTTTTMAEEHQQQDGGKVAKAVSRASTRAESDYPTGVRLALILLSIFVSMFLVALDRLIISTWSNGRIIALLILGALLLIGFVLTQIFMPKTATVAPRIFKQRSIIAGFWATVCIGSQMMIFGE